MNSGTYHIHEQVAAKENSGCSVCKPNPFTCYGRYVVIQPRQLVHDFANSTAA